MSRNWLITLLMSVILCRTVMSSSDNRRPFYVIGHMVNSADDIEGVLRSGANAIETDVNFQEDGRPVETFHGFPCDWGRYCSAREIFTNYLDYIRLRGTPGSPVYNSTTMALLYLDLKVNELTSKALKKAGRFLAQGLFRHLYGNGSQEIETPWLVIGIPDVKHFSLYRSLIKTLVKSGYSYIADRLGVDFYYSSNVDKKFDAMKALENHSSTLWLSEGFSNWFPPNYNRLDMLVNLARDKYSAHPVRTMVYQWTVDGDASLRNSLQYDIDGIVTNTPDILNRLLKEKEFATHFRLATIDDEPGAFTVDGGDDQDYTI